MSRPYAAPPPSLNTPWLLLGALWGGAGLAFVVWLSGYIATELAGSGERAPFGFAFVRAFLAGEFSQLWPGTPPLLVAGVFLAMSAAAGAAVWGVWRLTSHWRRGSDDPLRSLADRHEMGQLSPAVSAKTAQRLRPSLTSAVSPDDSGVLLGKLRPSGVPLRSSWEDVLLAVMAPRSGKTTALAIPTVLAAPGAVVATSNKAELLTTTSAARSERGRIWAFDPQSIAYTQQTWWWNPLRGLSTVEDATRLSKHFTTQVKNAASGQDFWVSAAEDLLTSLLMAASRGGYTVVDVYEWLSDPAHPTPSELLEQHGYTALARSLRGKQLGAVETRDGIYETARTASACLRDPEITRWVTPGHVENEFSPHAFVMGTDTLYLMSKDGAGAGPLVAALTDRVMTEAVRYAEACAGRLDPPLLLVLDEAANICRIQDLPALYSHLGSRGVIPCTILQSYKQGVGVWGEAGMDSLWSAATVKLVGSGLDDAKTATDLSTLIGEHDVATTSISRSHRGEVNHSATLRRQKILSADKIRALPKGTALLLATGVKAALIELVPWYTSALAQRVSSAESSARTELVHRAQQKWRGGGSE